ncbi:MAG TPA: hypothetical protein VHX99_08635, partial [Rhizomicrobium sp.]|nr:hypothetical protein [Rhizomicrobium sp.]
PFGNRGAHLTQADKSDLHVSLPLLICMPVGESPLAGGSWPPPGRPAVKTFFTDLNTILPRFGFVLGNTTLSRS